MLKLSADYIFSITKEPIKNGILIINGDGTVIDLISSDERDYDIPDIIYHEGILCPGFLNPHCHLELSYLRNQIPKHTGLNDFIFNVEKFKKKDFSPDMIYEAIEKADKEMQENGIVAVGDIVNTSHSFEIKKKSNLHYHNFVELYGSNPDKATEIFDNGKTLFRQFNNYNPASIVPHSAYSVSDKLLKKIKHFAEENDSIISIHHQENKDENDFFRDKSGLIVQRAEKFKIDISKFKATGLSPLQSISEYLPVDNNIQLVHNTVSTAEDIHFGLSAFNKLWWTFCPDSNLFIENALPDIELFINSNCNITVATDSLASNHELSIFKELITISSQYPQIQLHQLLKWATINAAELLKIDNQFGSFDINKKPGILLLQNTQNLSLNHNSKIKVLY